MDESDGAPASSAKERGAQQQSGGSRCEIATEGLPALQCRERKGHVMGPRLRAGPAAKNDNVKHIMRGGGGRWWNPIPPRSAASARARSVSRAPEARGWAAGASVAVLMLSIYAKQYAVCVKGEEEKRGEREGAGGRARVGRRFWGPTREGEQAAAAPSAKCNLKRGGEGARGGGGQRAAASRPRRARGGGAANC